MDLKEVERVVSRIKSSLFKNSNSYSIGMMKSQFRGVGLQFKEHQLYTYGDDIRFIDWKIFAKTSNAYIKTFDEERNVEIVVVIDASLSMLSGVNGVSKLQACIEICCMLYLLAKETGDHVHALIVSDKIINVPKSSGEAGIVNLIYHLEQSGLMLGNGKINICYEYSKYISDESKFSAILKHSSKRHEIILLSDLNDFFRNDILKALLARKNSHFFKIESPLDLSESLPYSIFSKNGQVSGKGSQVVANSGKTQNNLEAKLKRIKKLNIESRYLDEFIKELI